MLKRIDHIGVIVDDLAQARRFLERLGLELVRTGGVEGRLGTAFYRCGDVDIEVIEVFEPGERHRRLGEATARIEHIAIEVDGLSRAMAALAAIGVAPTSDAPVAGAGMTSYWTAPETSDGVMYQVFERS